MGKNIKVHFAASENPQFLIAEQVAGINYSLFSVYNYIKSKKVTDSMKVERTPFPPPVLEKTQKHVIMDSGLFTLMFGSQAGKKDRKFLEEWQEKQTRFVLENNLKCTCVEIDCQKILGVDDAWYFRKRMKELLPNNPQINVFHLEDGMKGLDRLIEFSDYIAISIPELRIHKKGTYKDDTIRLAEYIKGKKPHIDIHLLGCTEKYILERTRFCTSADSTSWTYGLRYGHIQGTRIERISNNLKGTYRDQCIATMEKDNVKVTESSLDNILVAVANALYVQKQYEQYCGPQD